MPPSTLGTLANSLNAGTLGVSITRRNSGGASGLAFDKVVTTGGARLVYDNTYTRGVGLSARHTAGPGGNSYYEWNRALGSPSVWYGRVYVRLAGLPSGDIRLVRAQGGEDLELVIEVTRGGTVRVRDSANRIIATSIQPIELGAWVRLEWKVDHATGQIEVRVFNSPNLTTPSETLVTAAGQSIGSHPDRVQIGRSGSQSFSSDFWTDDPSLSITGFVGPAE